PPSPATRAAPSHPGLMRDRRPRGRVADFTGHVDMKPHALDHRRHDRVARQVHGLARGLLENGAVVRPDAGLELAELHDRLRSKRSKISAPDAGAEVVSTSGCRG